MLRDYNYVDDIVEALILASQSDKAIRETFYLGCERPISLIGLANLIIKIAGSGKIEITQSPRKWGSIEIGDFYACYAKIKEKLGWVPMIDLETGIRKTMKFYADRLLDYF